MRKETVSLYGLIDLKAFNKVLKSSDMLFWSREPESGADLVCNGHFVVRAFIPENSDAFATLCGRFHGVPETMKRADSRGVADAPDMYCNLETMLAVENGAAVRDTMLSQRTEDGRHITLFRSSAADRGAEYVGIDEKYSTMIFNADAVYQETPSRLKPVCFENSKELALILPINRQFNMYLK